MMRTERNQWAKALMASSKAKTAVKTKFRRSRSKPSENADLLLYPREVANCASITVHTKFCGPTHHACERALAAD